MSNEHSHQDYTCQLCDFQDRPVWVAWRNEPRTNKTGQTKITKVPYCGVRREAKSNDPSTWIGLDDADELRKQIVNGSGGGIGIFMGFDAGSGMRLGGIDLDTCRRADGTIEPWASEIVERFRSYTEVSPSGSGVKVFFLYRETDLKRLQQEILGERHGKKVAARTGKEHPPAIELYLAFRYFAITAQSNEFPYEIRLVHYDDLVWLVQDAMRRFDVETDGVATGTAPSGTAKPKPGNLPRDNSRSGIAFHKVVEWRRWGKVTNCREMIAMLLDDPETSEWANEYKDEPTQRQFQRLWKNTTPTPESIDDRFAEIAQLVMAERRAAVEGQNDQPTHIPTGATTDPNESDSEVRESVAALLDPAAPSFNAMVFIAMRSNRLIYWRGDFLEWSGTHYRIVEQTQIEAEIYRFLDGAKTAKGPFKATRSKVLDLIHAVRAKVVVRSDFEPKSNLATGQLNRDLIVFRNGVLALAADELLPHRDELLILNSLPFDYLPDAPVPTEWLRFLNSLWPDEPEHISHLQEIIGYAISGRTDYHKVFMFLGPPRSGKGTIAWAITELLGRENVVSPPLARLPEQFALQSAIGKSAIIVGDARLGSRTDLGRLTEILLNISGQDRMTVPRKHRDDWVGPLPARIFIMSNTSPRLVDESAAIASRLIPVRMTRSFLGKEDRDLIEKLRPELPMILAWAIKGLRRLDQRGKFQVPDSAKVLVEEAKRAASPIAAFVDDMCITDDPDAMVTKERLYNIYCQWCQRTGHKMPSDAKFAMDLRSVLPTIDDVRPRSKDGSRPWYWKGIRLIDPPDTFTPVNDDRDAIPYRPPVFE